MSRVSDKVLQARGALANLNCIADLADEAQSLGESATAVFARNAHDVQRWVNTVIEGGLEVPPAVNRHKTFWIGA